MHKPMFYSSFFPQTVLALGIALASHSSQAAEPYWQYVWTESGVRPYAGGCYPDAKDGGGEAALRLTITTIPCMDPPLAQTSYVFEWTAPPLVVAPGKPFGFTLKNTIAANLAPSWTLGASTCLGLHPYADAAENAQCATWVGPQGNPHYAGESFTWNNLARPVAEQRLAPPAWWGNDPQYGDPTGRVRFTFFASSSSRHWWSYVYKLVEPAAQARPLWVTPPSGSGGVQTFAAAYNHPVIAQNIRWAQLLFAAAPDGGGEGFCLLHYDAAGNSFWLYSDVSGFFAGPVAPGTASNRLQGTQCILDTAASGVTRNGNVLTVRSAVVFKSAAARKVYLRQMTAEGADSGWVQHGVWTQTAAPLPPAPTVTPSSGSGGTPTFTVTYADPPGFSGYASGWNEFLVAAESSGGGQPFCFLHYDRAGNGLWMYSSDVGFFRGPVPPGTASSLLNSSACSVNTGGSTVQSPAGQLRLAVPLTLKTAMRGSKKLFARQLDALMRDSGWVQAGTWTIP